MRDPNEIVIPETDHTEEEPLIVIPDPLKEWLLEVDEIARRDEPGRPEVFTFSDFVPRFSSDAEPEP